MEGGLEDKVRGDKTNLLCLFRERRDLGPEAATRACDGAAMDGWKMIRA